MKRITTALTHRLVATAIKWSWAVQTAGERKQALGERMEAWAHRLAVRWGCVDDVLATITTETLRSR
ncbi:hypothetical protein FXV83_05285 [Bradyrhizobium hipponense]|uniref:Transposase n=1 Tax=Bradyrhizobium hipponense TaxID=2605638 RepID=A0A5S4YVY9_9BRAD|nr:hypothetical protein [Bradyrhizobium hipponense]TYO67575.1 hypothetical protein FXV83_05285 [Bradyrhizobium hipponense]